METFKKNLQEIKSILAAKRKLTELALRSRTSIRLVQNTFQVNSFDELTGKKLTVYQESIKMVDEINSLPQQASMVIKEE